MKRICIFLTAILLTGNLAFAHRVSVEDARIAALKFFTEHFPFSRTSSGDNIFIYETRTFSRDGTMLYYIFNMDPPGWIMISADDAAFPVMAYSFEGNYTGRDLPPQFLWWMKQYEDELFNLAGNSSPPSPATGEFWNKLLNNGNLETERSEKGSRSVEPLLASGWNQNSYYNGKCPADPAGPDGHAYAGCVPTAMGQLMYYYRWPRTGTGSYTYTDPRYGQLSADFGATTYQWENMPDEISRPNDGIALLLYHLGVSCDLVYGPGGSGMYNHKAAYSLRTYFKYSPQTQYLFRDSTSLRWDSILVAHLDRKMPMYYAGWSNPNVDGHAFVCDGYQDTTWFHFNWGWSRSYNGYFYTNNLAPGGNNFRMAQELIINCFPDTVNYTYPEGCQGTDTILWLDGSVTDGYGPVKNYSPAADCSWLIDPQNNHDSVSKLSVSFDYFDLGLTDYVNVYDGKTTDAPLLGSFSGQNLPPSLTSSGNKVLLKFKVNSCSAKGKGWKLTYSSSQPEWCSGTQVIIADTAVITNGSLGFDYYNNSSCRWRIERKDSLPLTVWFRRFDTEPDKDILSFYDLGNEQPVDTVSGRYDTTALPMPVTSPSGKMFLIFSTNNSVTGKGWEIYYPKKNTGIIGHEAIAGLKIFPNPASYSAFAGFSSEKDGISELFISSPDGRVLRRQTINYLCGANEISIDLSGMADGLYLIRLVGPLKSAVSKLIIQKE